MTVLPQDTMCSVVSQDLTLLLLCSRAEQITGSSLQIFVGTIDEKYFILTQHRQLETFVDECQETLCIFLKQKVSSQTYLSPSEDWG